MNITPLLNGFILFFIGQAMIWYQTNSQFFNQWAKDHPFVMAMCGLPISYILIYASRYVVEGFNGLLWPGRFVGFAIGMVVMAILTWYHMGETITLKTGITLFLALIIISIQILWK
jgi:hypothetical protein